MFICGSRNFPQGENELCNSPCRTPKRSKFYFFKNKEKSNKINPFAELGLDRFSQLLAEHENRKQQIYAELGSENISLVRFVYTNDSNVIKPIVVRTLDNSKRLSISPRCSNISYYKDQHEIPKSDVLVVDVPEQEEDLVEKKRKKRSLRTCRLDNLRRRFCYLLAILVTILLLLALPSRIFAIFCMTIGWYMVPDIDSESQNRRKPKRKKESIVHSKRLFSPRTGVTSDCLSEDKNQHVRRRSC